ncbi:MAG TPA: PTS ascorbate transporter subunit IIC [Saprospiraceae bacterium]|nr:PTS ascorbate transporter subunit IIC [Saprospiraceae bacterium]
MAAKKSFVLRIDDATYAALEKWAADEFRSVNGQLEWMIDRALKETGRSPKDKSPQEPPPPDDVQFK